MSRYDSHLHVPNDPAFFTPRRPRPTSPADAEEGLAFNFNPPPNPSSLLDPQQLQGPTMFEPNSGAAAAAMTAEEQIARLQQIAAAQQKQIDDANAFAQRQAEFLQEYQRQLQASQ